MRGSIHTCGKWIHPRAYLTIPLWVISLEYSVYLTTPLSRLWLKTQTYLAATLNIRYIWPHHCQTFDLSFRWIHLTTLLASLWLESQTLLYRAFVKPLTRISDILCRRYYIIARLTSPLKLGKSISAFPVCHY